MACNYLERGSLFEDSICGVTKRSIPKYTISSVCDTFGKYMDCESYKKASGNCFITSSVCYAMGMADDCDELMAIRGFRDQWLKKQEFGQRDVAEYYDCAPKICHIINSSDRPKEIYREIYDTYILPCVKYIKENNCLACYELYKRMVYDLKERFVIV